MLAPTVTARAPSSGHRAHRERPSGELRAVEPARHPDLERRGEQSGDDQGVAVARHGRGGSYAARTFIDPCAAFRFAARSSSQKVSGLAMYTLE